jgi:hypothetical protein
MHIDRINTARADAPDPRSCAARWPGDAHRPHRHSARTRSIPIAPRPKRRRRMRCVGVQAVHRINQSGEPRHPKPGESPILKPRDRALVDPGCTLQVALRPVEGHPPPLDHRSEDLPAALDFRPPALAISCGPGHVRTVAAGPYRSITRDCILALQGSDAVDVYRRATPLGDHRKCASRRATTRGPRSPEA